GRRDWRDRGRHQGPVLAGRTRDDLVCVHARYRGRGVRHRAHLGRPHQPGGDVVAGGVGKFSWREVPGYWAAQLAGAIAGAAAIYLTLGRLATITAGGGVTAYNPATMGFGRGLLIEALGTFILVFVIFGVIDHRAVPGWAPMAIGAIVV